MFLNAKLIPLSAPIRTLILHAVCRGYFLELTHIVTEITECRLSNRKEFLLVRSATTVATANSANQVTITWSSPVTNGSPITAYKIYIRQKDQTTYT